ncbi:MAG: FAD-dependent oxidoreductase [Xanthobacteraceae bacterium]|jgi:pyruvate/2-oxoglutarate dehydrogenase complex dihydrolipoamide dehydrogenase (E3) component
MDELRPDLCVIGAGAGGLSVAAAAAAFGVPVVLIEKGRMGGDCLNYGCVPSKALLAAARRVADMRTASDLGVNAAAVRVDFPAVAQHVRDTIAALAPNDSAARFTGLGVRVIAGSAQFADRETVTVDDRFTIKARRFVIATGSTPSVPRIPGIAQTPFFTNETIFDLALQPEQLLIVGGGPVGVELAQAFRRLGSTVTVIEAATPLGKDDPECAAVVLAALERDGVVFRSGVRLVKVAGASTIQVTLSGGEVIEGSHLLIAAGRTPTIEGLGLERAGVATTPHGITVDRHLRTTNKHIYAIGDVIGGLQFTHVANDHAGIVIRHALFRLPARIRYDAIPWVTYTDPELAQVGLTEDQARRAGHAVRILRWPYHENDRARIERASGGHIKVVTNRRGRILGATIVGRDAGELISIFTLAITQRLNIRALAGFIVPYPTLAEIGKRAAMSHFTPSLTSPMVRRIIGWLRRLG